MTKEEVQKLIESEISRFKDADKKKTDALDNEIKNLIRETVKEILGEDQKTETVTVEDVTKMIKESLEPLYKSRGIPTNLNSEPDTVEKSGDVFSGLFA
ncbi:MAG: hypothetical protein NC320_11525 [Clostridium sp.]|nr:hypothetical protein [Clostridium sp.]